MPAAAEKTSRSQPPGPGPAGGGRLPLLVSAVAVLVAAGAAGGWYWSARNAPEAERQAVATPHGPRLPAPAQYLALEPPFVVNLDGGLEGTQYLQVEIQLMTRDPAALADLERHTPAIRARLLMLLAQQTAQDIADRAGKERLQAQALAEVQRLMRAETGKPAAEALLFTSFVTQ
ncbi:flagellar basal body-associated FliL family protein [Pseudoxanthomonas sp. J35]|uniref:flagellar basal body-associated FliL family protein n=1 Tax=Pseudoxanthomonas sp. J35 TaxID=935852 RepID=UPI0004901B06|nr:flagellar basal body-associated FliL family protein [Pseudoxanthomonas sp. J35]